MGGEIEESRVAEIEGLRVAGIEGSRVAGIEGSRVAGIERSRVAGIEGWGVVISMLSELGRHDIGIFRKLWYACELW